MEKDASMRKIEELQGIGPKTAAVLREMEALGFDSGFIQPLDSADCYNPDFSREERTGPAGER